MNRLTRLCSFKVLLVACMAHAVGAQSIPSSPRLIDEAWYVLSINDVRAGFASEKTFNDGNRYRTVNHHMMRVRRGADAAVTVEMTTTSIETHQGDPVSMAIETKTGSHVERRAIRFEDGEIIETVTRNGRTYEERHPAPEGPWLMPHAASTYESLRLTSGVDSIRYRVLDASSSLHIAEIRMSRMGEQRVRLVDRSIDADRWRVERVNLRTGHTQTSEVLVSEDAEVVELRESLGTMRFVARWSSEEVARRPIGAGPELLTSSFVQLNRRIPGAHRTTNATYVVRLRGDTTFAFPSAGAQEAEALENGDYRLDLDVSRSRTVTLSESERATNLASTLLVDLSDTELQSFADRVLRKIDPSDDAARAERLRRAVHAHIDEKNYAVALATASEALRSRTGDCTEHAILLCGLLRHAGIPSRVANGLVYVDSYDGGRHAFGWHMWTQALIDGRWVDLDATLDRAFSAAHILTSVSDLEGGSLNDELSKTGALIGQLAIEIESLGYKPAARTSIDE